MAATKDRSANPAPGLEAQEFHPSIPTPVATTQQRALARKAKEVEDLERRVPEALVMAENPVLVNAFESSP